MWNHNPSHIACVVHRLLLIQLEKIAINQSKLCKIDEKSIGREETLSKWLPTGVNKKNTKKMHLNVNNLIVM